MRIAKKIMGLDEILNGDFWAIQGHSLDGV